MSLKILLCNNNKITNLPPSMANLSSLQKLDISQNLIVKTNKKGEILIKKFNNKKVLNFGKISPI